MYIYIYMYVCMYIYTHRDNPIYAGLFPLGGISESHPLPGKNLLIPSPPRKISP